VEGDGHDELPVLIGDAKPRLVEHVANRAIAEHAVGFDARPGGNPFAPKSYRLLSTLGDFVIFRGSLSNIVAEGRFTRDWKVPAETAAALQSAGTVIIH